MMTRDDVIDVLTIVAAATRRTIGEADVQIWQAIIGADDKQLAMRAVHAHLTECPGIWLEPGHIHQRVRAYRRDQLERETRHELQARQDALAAKAAADELDRLTAGAFTPPAERPQPPAPPSLPTPRMVRCRWCHAGPGAGCDRGDRKPPAGGYHPTRIQDALECIR